MQKSLTFVFLLITISSLLFAGSLLVFAQTDADNDGLSDSSEQEIALSFSPNLQFATGEKFFPVNVDYHISNSVLKLKSSEGDQVVSSSPTVEEISTFASEDYYLDNKLGGLSEISSDYSAQKDILPPVVYARVTPSQDSIVVQYWFFYAYNEGPLNEHEGDWEMIEVILDQNNPMSASYSQHLSGQRASWEDVEKVDQTHPIVYVALGSHANYFRSYQGNFGLESDIVGNDGERIAHGQLTLIMLGELGPGNHPSSQAWLDFGGRWGDWANFADAVRGTAGPFGPAQGENSPKWIDPVGWSLGVQSLNTVFLILNLVVANFIPIFGIAVVALSIVRIRGIVKLRKKGGLVIPAILKSRAAAGVGLGIIGTLLTIGAIINPWYAVQGDIQSQEIQTNGLVNLILIDGFNGLQVNTLQEGQGLTSVFNFAIPFAIIMLISVVFGFVDIIAAKSSRNLASNFIKSGIGNLLPVIFILIFIFQLTLLLESISSLGFVAGSEVKDFAQQVSSAPIQGEYFTSGESYGNVNLTWSLELGSYLFIGAALVKFIAGAITGSAKIPKEDR